MNCLWQAVKDGGSENFTKFVSINNFFKNRFLHLKANIFNQLRKDKIEQLIPAVLTTSSDKLHLLVVGYLREISLLVICILGRL